MFAYSYDRAGQLASETIQGGQRPASQTLTYGYDAAGQLTTINDSALNEVTTYAYDRAGHRVRETITQAGKTYQDNHLAYDTLGRLRDITTDQAHLTISYDNAGNRTYIGTHVMSSEGTSLDSQRYYLYDAMNRQTLVDGIDANGTLSSTQGHRLTYDQNGNRLTDTRVTTRVYYNPATGGVTASYTYSANQEVAESYAYDAMDRLTTVTRNDGQNNSTVIDHRYYDKGSRVVQTGVLLDAGYAAGMDGTQGDSSNPHLNHYDAQGRLIRQTVKSYGNGLEYIIDYTGIDAMGNVTGYRVSSYQGSGYSANYTLNYLRFDGYQQSTATSTVASGTFTASTVTNTFDANGNLTRVDDSSDVTKTRYFVNDEQGHSIWVQRTQGVEQQLVVNGEVLGRYGMGVDPTKPLVNGQPQYSDRADFNFGYQSARSQGMNGPMVHTVASGETLQGMAQAYYGDASLWYIIADANGLTSDADMQVGQTITIPARTAGVHNASGTYKPYDASEMVSPTGVVERQPNPVGQDGCGVFGMLVATVITVVVAAIAEYYFPGSGASVYQAMAKAFAIAAISQEVSVAVGVQDHMDWKGVALSAVSAGVTYEVGSVADTGSELGNTMENEAIHNAITQGIGVATGLQDHFDWMQVVASAAGAGIGQEMSQGLLGKPGTSGYMQTDFAKALGGGDTAKFAGSLLTGVAAGMAVSLLDGGRVAMQQVITDSFGNALGESIADKEGKTANGQQGAKPNELHSMIQQEQAGAEDRVNRLIAGATNKDPSSDTVDFTLDTTIPPAPVPALMGLLPYSGDEDNIPTVVTIGQRMTPEQKLAYDMERRAAYQTTFLEQMAASAHENYQNREANATNGASAVVWHVAGLLSDIGYGGAAGMHRLLTDPNAQFNTVMKVGQALTHPMQTATSAVNGLKNFASKPFGEKADTVFKLAVGSLATGGFSGEARVAELATEARVAAEVGDVGAETGMVGEGATLGEEVSPGMRAAGPESGDVGMMGEVATKEPQVMPTNAPLTNAERVTLKVEEEQAAEQQVGGWERPGVEPKPEVETLPPAGEDVSSTDVLRGMGSRGVRNTEILTQAQETQLYKHVEELGLNPQDFRISSHVSAYSDNWDVTFLGPNMFPAEARTANTVFETMTPRAAVAHEAGHMITTRAGTAFEAGSLYDEVGASLTGRELPGLNSVERYQLLRDAVERARNEGRNLRDVLSEMRGQ